MADVATQVPFNLDLLILNAASLKQLSFVQQVKVMDIMEQSSSNFHPLGLFSVDIFGKVGDEKRNRLFGYIDLGIDVFHPIIYKSLLDLKELYGNIIAGTKFAIFNKATNDFEESNPVDGNTGFSFFMEHFPRLKFEDRPSTQREFKIKLINKYRESAATFRYLLVMPAGLRDFTIDPNGKRSEDEINTIYRQALAIGNIAFAQNKINDKSHLDQTRFRIQQVVLSLYQYITNLLEGDSKLIQSHWTARNIFYSTRNVITASAPKPKKLFDEQNIGPNAITVGIYQHIRSVFPIFVNLIRVYAEKVFSGPNTPANLIDKKTLKKVTVQVDPQYYDDWFTQQGIEELLNQFSTEDLRFDPIEVDGYYFGLIYRDGSRFKFFQDIDELPEGFDKNLAKPVTFAELFYIAIFESTLTAKALSTRYPVINLGGIFPCEVYMKTTTKSDQLELLSENWGSTGKIYPEFPVEGNSFFNSLSISFTKLGRSGADHDGDTMNYEVLMTEDALEEIESLLQSASYYVGLGDVMNYSSENDVSKLVFLEMSS